MVTDILTAAVLLAFVFIGSKRGAMKMLLSALGLVVSILAGMFLYQPVSELLAGTGLEARLAEKLGENMDRITELPGIMRDFIAMTGADDKLASAVAGAAVGALCFLSVAVLVRVLLLILGAVMGLAASLPVIRQANGLLGGILGLLEGAVALFVIFGVVALIEAFGHTGLAAKIFDGSHMAALIYDNNPLLGLVAGAAGLVK